MNVQATFIEQDFYSVGHTKFEPTLQPGTCHWKWYDPPSNGVEASLNFICPCGCGEGDFIFVAKGQTKQQSCWKWDGNKAKPTLEPSIFRVGAECKWHGFLKNGEWIKA